MDWDKKAIKTVVACLLLAVIALVSALGLAKVAADPETHRDSIAALDEKKVTVMELTAATAVSAVAISAVPGDATTPIADQIAELSSYLLIVTGVLMLEKFLLVATGHLAFAWLIPVACVLGILYQVTPRAALKQLAIRLAAFGIAICLVIPASIRLSELFEETFQLQQAVEDAAQATQEIEDGTEAQEKEEQSGLGGWLAGLGDQITGGLSDALEKAKQVLNDFIDAVAVLLISNCVIPVLVMFLFLWLVKAVVALPLENGKGKAPALPPPGPAPRPEPPAHV